MTQLVMQVLAVALPLGVIVFVGNHPYFKARRREARYWESRR